MPHDIDHHDREVVQVVTTAQVDQNNVQEVQGTGVGRETGEVVIVCVLRYHKNCLSNQGEGLPVVANM